MRSFRSANRRLAAAAAVTVLLLVPLGVFGAPALARTASAVWQYGQPGSAQYQYRVQVCHRTHSTKHPYHLITISNRALHAHLRHGDWMPPCDQAPTAAPHHGKGHEGHGNPHADVHVQSPSQGHDDDDGGGHGNGGHGHHGK